MINMSIIELKKFLINAKKNTYAAGSGNKAKILSNGVREYVFSEGDFRYTDKYSGHEKFSGEENVFKNNKIIWRMSYSGGILSDEITVDNIYSFLKKALKQIPDDKPLRGPKELVDKGHKYTNNIKGDIDKFSGEEKIFYKNKLMYSLSYDGEAIEPAF